MEVHTTALAALLVGACWMAWILMSHLRSTLSHLQKLHNNLRDNDRALERTTRERPREESPEVESSSDE